MGVNKGRYKGSWRPLPQQELLLKAALLAGERAVESWKAWKACIDVNDLDSGSHRMLPLLYRNLRANGVDDPAMGIYKGVYRRTWYRNQVLFRAVAPLLNAFRDAGIETMSLKGAPLAVLYYKDCGLRPMNDFDVLVRPERVPQAIDLLQRMGWSPNDFMPTARYISAGYSHGFRNRAGDELDLHWHLLSESRGRDADDGFWSGAIPAHIGDVATFALGPADQLLHACIHGARWNYIPPFRWAADAAIVLDSARDQIDWDRIIIQAERMRLALPLREALNYLKDLLDVMVPSEILKRLDDLPVSPIEHMEYRINTNPPTRWAAMLDLWCQHSRLQESAGLFHKLVSFPEFLGRIWDRGVLNLPFCAMSKVLKWRRN